MEEQRHTDATDLKAIVITAEVAKDNVHKLINTVVVVGVEPTLLANDERIFGQ